MDTKIIIESAFGLLYVVTLYFLKGFADSVKSLSREVTNHGERIASLEGAAHYGRRIHDIDKEL